MTHERFGIWGRGGCCIGVDRLRLGRLYPSSTLGVFSVQDDDGGNDDDDD